MLTLLDELKYRNEALFYFGMLLFAGAVLCSILVFFTDKQVLGINSFIKPFKFFLSTGIYVWTMGWITFYLDEEKKVSLFNGVVIAVLAFETIYIFWQAARGQLSHFNISSKFNGAMFSLMGIAISIMTLWTGYIAYLFFTKSFPALPAAYLWGIRLGLVLFVIFAFEGGLMGARLAHTVGAADGGEGIPLVNWSKRNGDLRISHFVGMHALQLLPLFGYYISRSVTITIIFAIVYFIVSTLLMIQALMGKPLLNYLKRQQPTAVINQRK